MQLIVLAPSSDQIAKLFHSFIDIYMPYIVQRSSLLFKHILPLRAIQMNKPVLAIDLDDTLGPLIQSIAEFHNEFYGTCLKIEDFISYQFVDVWGGSKEDTISKVSQFFESHYISQFYPFQGAYESLSRLKLDFDLHVVTARQNSIENLTREWISTYFPGIFTEIHFGNHFTQTNAITKSKSEICTSIGAKLLIDDNIGHAVDCASKANMHAIIFGQYGWNRNEVLLETCSEPSVLSRISRMQSWKDVEREVYRIFAASHNSLRPLHSQQLERPLRMACIQMCSGSDKVANLAATIRLVEQAVIDGAKFVCLPECRYSLVFSL